MESAKNGNEYTLMAKYGFNKPIEATITFDSDEDELNLIDSDYQEDTKCLDMPPLDGHNSKAEVKLDNVVTEVIKKYICKNKIARDKKSPKRKLSTTSETNENKLKRKNNKNMNEIRSQLNEPSASSPEKNCQLGSSAEPSGPSSDVSNNIRSLNNSSISSSLLNGANRQPISASIKPNVEPIENPSIYLSKEEKTSQQNTSTSSALLCTDNKQAGYTCVNQKVETILDSHTSANTASEEIRNLLDPPTSSSPKYSYNRQPIAANIELKAKLIGDSNLQSNLSYEITIEKPKTSNLRLNTDKRQYNISTCNGQKVKLFGNSSSSVNDLIEECIKEIDKTGNQLNTLSSTNMSEVIRNQLNTSNFSTPTNSNNTQPVSTDVNSKIQPEHYNNNNNNNNSLTYEHLKPLLDTVSEHLILIMKRTHSCNGILNDKFQQNFEFKEELKKKIYHYKIRLFDLSYSTVVNVILPRAYDKTFVKNFIDNTVVLSKSENRQTTKEISMLYLEMINWAQKMKEKIASESLFENKIRQPLAPHSTDTSGQPRIMKESTNPHSTHNYTYSIRPPETQRSSQWNTKSYPPPPYTYNIPPLSYTNHIPQSYPNNMPQYINTVPPHTYVNNFITPQQTTVMNSTYNEHDQISTKPTQKKNGKTNQKQVTVAEVARRAVSPTDGLRQESNITQVNNTINNHNVNVFSNQARGTYQNYQPTYLPTLPNSNHAQCAYSFNNNLTANNTPHPKAIAESEYQKHPGISRPRNVFNYNTSSENQNHCNRASDTSTQRSNNYTINAFLNQTQANNNIQQESDRSSISRDSGFFSPREFEQEPSTSPISPLITHVTSLNPEAVNIIRGSCFVCGKNTNQKCVGCYSIYYCSYGCQNFDWRNHMPHCNTNQELRRLLCK